MDHNRRMCFKLTIAALLMGCYVVDAKLSDHITTCKAKDPNLEQCLKDAGHAIITKSEKGLKEFGIPPVDPMVVPYLELKQGANSNSPIGMTLHLINSTHTGLTSTKILKARADPAKYEFEFHSVIPSYSIVGYYDVDGKMMLLPIKGKGDSNITLYNLDVVWNLKGEPETRDGVQYMKLKQFHAAINPKNMKVRFDGLFGENKVLGETMNGLLNTHWQEIYKQLKPSLEESYSKILFSFADRIFSKTPYNEIFA